MKIVPRLAISMALACVLVLATTQQIHEDPPLPMLPPMPSLKRHVPATPWWQDPPDLRICEPPRSDGMVCRPFSTS